MVLLDCLDENQALSYVRGLLSPEREREVISHVAACSECRWLLNEAGGAVLQESVSEAVTGELDAPSVTDEVTTPLRRVAAEEDPSSRIGELLSNTYVIERYIGRGGMGTVYEGSHRRLPRRFAIKILSPALARDAVAIARIRREAEVTSRLSHPHIVDVVDFNHAADGTPFVVMELLEGQSLAQRIKRDGPMKLAEVVEVARQVISALGAAHREGIVHRDLKPSNIFLCRSSDGIQVKVMDFGLSKIWSAPPGKRLTRVMAVIGTPSFMSPEQASGRTTEADFRSDVFSLCATLFTVLTGSAPFGGETIAEVLDQVIGGKLSEVRAWRRVPEPVRDAISRGLDKDPERRTQSMDALWHDLSRAFSSRAVVKPRGDKSGHRSRWPLWVSAGCLGAAAAVLAAIALRDPPRPMARAASGLDAGRVEGAARDASPPRPAREIVTIKTRVDAAASSAGRAKYNPGRRARKRPKPRAAERKIPAAPPVGTLVMQSKSRRDGKHIWADVQLDGKAVGRSGLTLKGVAAGEHLVQFSRAGYRPVTRSVTVRPGQRTRVTVELIPTISTQ